MKFTPKVLGLAALGTVVLVALVSPSMGRIWAQSRHHGMMGNDFDDYGGRLYPPGDDGDANRYGEGYGHGYNGHGYNGHGDNGYGDTDHLSSMMGVHGHGTMTMDLGPHDATFDLRFIDAMVPHHQGAVVMAQQVLDKSQRSQVRDLAQAIIDAQEQEISQMQQWRQTWYPDASPEAMMYDTVSGRDVAMGDDIHQSMMMREDLGPAGDQFDLRFLQAMIPHHEGALAMAQQVLAKSDRPEMLQLANGILASQQQEIDQMIQWQRDWYPEGR